MKVAFTEGVIVRFKIPGGASARIIRYLREGYYLIKTIPDQRELIAEEDDLELANKHLGIPASGYSINFDE